MADPVPRRTKWKRLFAGFVQRQQNSRRREADRDGPHPCVGSTAVRTVLAFLILAFVLFGIVKVLKRAGWETSVRKGSASARSVTSSSLSMPLGANAARPTS